jgi:hypothetical protein
MLFEGLTLQHKTRSQKIERKRARRNKRRASVTKHQREEYIKVLGKVLNKGIDNWKLMIARQERITEEEQYAALPGSPEPEIGD